MTEAVSGSTGTDRLGTDQEVALALVFTAVGRLVPRLNPATGILDRTAFVNVWPQPVSHREQG